MHSWKFSKQELQNTFLINFNNITRCQTSLNSSESSFSTHVSKYGLIYVSVDSIGGLHIKWDILCMYYCTFFTSDTFFKVIAKVPISSGCN